MAERTIKVRIEADDKASAQIESLANEILGFGKAAESKLGGIADLIAPGTGGFVALAGAIGATVASSYLFSKAFGAVRDEIASAVEAASASQLAERQLAVAVANTGQSVERVVPKITGYASQLQDLTGIEDETIISGQTMLVQFGRLSGEGLERATRAALDLGAATGDTDGAFRALSKAAQGNTTQLSKFGVVIDDSVPKSERFDVALAKIEQRVGGRAQAETQTYAGQMKILASTFDDLQEAIGGPLLEVAQIFLQNFLIPSVKGARDAAKGTETYRQTVLDLGIAVARVAEPFAVFVDFLSKNKNALSDALGIQDAINDIAALNAIFKALRVDMSSGTPKIIPDVSAIAGAGEQADTFAGRLRRAVEAMEKAKSSGASLGDGLDKGKSGLKGLGDEADSAADKTRKLVLGSVALTDALDKLGTSRVKLDTVVDFSAINDAVAELDRLELKGPRTTAEREQIADLRSQIARLRAESSDPLEIAIRNAGGDTLAKLHAEAERVGRDIAAVNEAELQGPKTEEAEANIARVKSALEKVAEGVTAKGVTIPGLSELEQSKIELRAQLTVLGLGDVLDAQSKLEKIRATIDKAFALQLVVPDNDPMAPVIRSAIAKLGELEEKAKEAGDSVNDSLTFGPPPFPEYVINALRDLGVVLDEDINAKTREFNALWEQARSLVGNGISTEDLDKLREAIQNAVDAGEALPDGFVKALPEVVRLDEAVRLLADVGVAGLNAKLKETATTIESLGQTIRRGLREEGLRAVDAFSARLANIGQDGRQSWHDFAEAVLRDLAAMLIRALLLKAIMAAINGAGGGSVALGAGGAAPPIAGPNEPAIPLPNPDITVLSAGQVAQGAGLGATAAPSSPEQIGTAADAGEAELAALEDTLGKKQELIAGFEEQRTAAEMHGSSQRTQAEIQADQASTQKHGSLLAAKTKQEASSIKQLQELTLQSQKVGFKNSQGLAKATAIVNTAQGVTRALAEGGPFAGPALAAMIAALGAVQIATIGSQKFAEGGFVKGAGDRDTVPALLTPGEFVVTKKITDMLVKTAQVPAQSVVHQVASPAARTTERAFGNFPAVVIRGGIASAPAAPRQIAQPLATDTLREISRSASNSSISELQRSSNATERVLTVLRGGIEAPKRFAAGGFVGGGDSSKITDLLVRTAQPPLSAAPVRESEPMPFVPQAEQLPTVREQRQFQDAMTGAIKIASEAQQAPIVYVEMNGTLHALIDEINARVDRGNIIVKASTAKRIA